MSDISRTSWSFWVRAESWTIEEATLILIGEIPFPTYDEIEADGQSYIFPYIEEYGAEDERELVRRAFPDGQVSPKKFFEWCRKNGLSLPNGLLIEARLLKSLDADDNIIANENESEVKEDRRKYRHEKIRIGILEAAFHLLSEKNRDEVVDYFTPNSGLNASKLAEELNDNRHRYEQLGTDVQYGTSFKNIRESIQSFARGDGVKRTQVKK